MPQYVLTRDEDDTLLDAQIILDKFGSGVALKASNAIQVARNAYRAR